MNEMAPATLSGSVPPPPHPREEERIARLLGYDILDTERDELFDRITAMAAEITGSPISLVSLVDRNRQWVKSNYGIDLKESSRDNSFCGHTVMDADNVMIIPDSMKDPRFVHNPFVVGEPHIRFYAGVPLRNGDGLAIGSLCVIDRKPRELTPDQIASLKNLARIAMDYLDIHRSNRELTRLLLREKKIYNRLLSMSSEMAASSFTLDQALQSIMDHLDPAMGWLSCRMTNLMTHGSEGIRMNPLLPQDPETAQIWRKIDSQATKPSHDGENTTFISTGLDAPKYAYLVVPIRNRGKQQAKIEMIYPDHRKMDPRIKEVFDIMAANLAIVAEREIATMELQHRAVHDALTGAVNRTLFLEELQKAISQTDSGNPDSALLFLDLDGFKDVNDNFGHQIGDRLLVEVTERLRHLIRQEDILGRLSGDEFVLLVSHLDIHRDLDALLKRIQRRISQPYMLGDLEIRITSSIGAAILDCNDLTTPELLRRAEESMYLVKHGERNGYCIATEDIIRAFKKRLDLDRNVHEAVYQKRLLLHFQPIVEIETGKICAAEALLRVMGKDGSILSAFDIIPAMERIRLMDEVDEWVFAESVRILQQHRKTLEAIPGFRLSLNVSPSILMTHGFATLSLNRLKAAGVSPTMIRLEIVEDHLDMSNASLMENITLFRNAGAKVAIDDFGTGYSNLQHLISIPCDTLKIDRLFIQGIPSGDEKKIQLLTAMLQLGKTLGYTVITEGIELQEQADHLLAIGCKYGQGYLYGKPMTIDQFLEHLMEQPPNELDLFSSSPELTHTPTLRHPQGTHS